MRERLAGNNDLATDLPKFGDRHNALDRAVKKGVAIMTSKILTSAAAFALATTAGFATTAPASAQYAQWNPGYVAADIAAGALATATMPFWGTGYGYYPGYAYSPDYAYGPGYTYTPEYSYGYGRYQRYRGYRGYYGYGGRGRCFQTCPHRNG
jgi:hypothetical protein